MAFLVALILFLIFTANVVIGAFGDGPIFGSITELCLLLSASVVFVIGILQREAREKKGAKTSKN